MEIAPYKVVLLDYETQQNNQHYLKGCLFIEPAAKTNNKKEITYSKKLQPYVNIKNSNDTLIIKLNLDRLYEDHNIKSNLFVEKMDLKLSADSSINIISNVYGLGANLKNIVTDDVNIKMTGSINIENCSIKKITPEIKRNNSFSIKKSKVDTLNIDLDALDWWEVKDCDIQVEVLTSSRHKSVYFPKSEARELYWNPKNKDARLNIELKADSAIVHYRQQ
ncbi:hypothetical protein D0T53_06970 [Dysgonomonas sp. 216]|nr:hypothetical protein [Dysgonomonas sp. 216]NDW18655.1 hypothetical protein [Dysgonomonas sp. 216]